MIIWKDFHNARIVLKEIIREYYLSEKDMHEIVFDELERVGGSLIEEFVEEIESLKDELSKKEIEYDKARSTMESEIRAWRERFAKIEIEKIKGE